MMRLLSKIFGKRQVVERENEPDLVYVPEEDERMQWAIEKARLTLWYFEKSLKKPGPAQQWFSVKVKIQEEEHTEHLWLNNPDLDEDGNLFGIVGNEPVNIQNVKMDQHIGVSRELISDWLIMESGRLIGGYTIRAIREGLPFNKRTSFDRSVGMVIDDGIDHFKADLNTPEGAILSIEEAYIAGDLSKAIACKDFYAEARLMLSEMKFHVEEELVRSTADALEMSYVQYMKREGMPDFSNVQRAFPLREKIDENHWIITEICYYPDGSSSRQRLSTYKTASGWKVMGVVEGNSRS